jgi:hypothetical protein
MKYSVTAIVALLFGMAAFRLAELLRWQQWRERLFILGAAATAAARMCAGVWM